MDRATELLVRQARAGDLRAFEELVRGFQDTVVAYPTSLLRDYHLAHDASQEAFIDAWQHLPALKEPAAFVSWLRRIVFKHCDRIMRRRRPPRSGIESALEVASGEPSPEEAMEAADAREALTRAIANLTAAEQDVVLLYYMGDRSQAEVADFLGITPNAVKTRLYSARRRFPWSSEGRSTRASLGRTEGAGETAGAPEPKADWR